MKSPNAVFDKIYNDYSKLVHSVVSHSMRGRGAAEVQDTIQEVWLDVWRSCQTGEAVGKNLVITIAQRRAWDKSESINRRREESLDSLTAGDADEDDAVGFQVSSDLIQTVDRSPLLKERMAQMVDQLPPQTKRVIELFYYAGRTVQQIAAELAITPGTVKAHLSRGRDTLRSMISPTGRKEAA